MISSAVKQQYKNDLKTLTKAWAKARVSKTSIELKRFQTQVNATSKSYDAYAMLALHQTLQTIQHCCAKGLSGKSTVAETSSNIDWLINQLIRSSSLNPDPFLLEAGDSESYLSLQTYSQKPTMHDAMHIAIIDDEASVGRALQAMLEQFALEVSYYQSIAEFEISLKSQKPHLVLLDITMPNVSVKQVFEFAQQLVARDMKVISCSALFNFETRLSAVRAGVSDFIVKPVSPYLLFEKITRALKHNVARSYQIVMLDDNQSMGEFYQAVFSQVDVNFHFFDSAEKLIAALEYLQPDLFLLDRVMPSVNGLEVAAIIRQDAKFDFSPIVFLTADEQLDTKLNVLAHGGDDLIAKSTPAPLVLEQILARLERSAFIKSFVSKDPLTGVLNHGQIVEAANHEIRLNRRQNGQCALALVDVDKFKAINDTHGHAAGDMVLHGLGQFLMSKVRETDYVGRYGGEEFVILFVNCSAQQALQKLEEIRHSCSSMPFVLNKPNVKISFSAGLIALEQYDALPQAISEADRLLYLAKEGGRNQIKTAFTETGSKG